MIHIAKLKPEERMVKNLSIDGDRDHCTAESAREARLASYIRKNTSEMIHHHGASPSKQQTADLLTILSWHTAGFVTVSCLSQI